VILFFVIFLFFDTNEYGNSIFMSKKNDLPDEYAYKDSRKPIYYDFIPEVPPM
jgi:hypothetical protein